MEKPLKNGFGIYAVFERKSIREKISIRISSS